MKKLRKQARELLQAANKVYHYRRDVIQVGRLEELERSVNELDNLVSDKNAEAQPMEAAMKRLDALLRKVGGKIYPKTFWSDNVEVLLVAAIIVIGIRTFFFQPFIIPTNSMYPTYSGMNAVVYTDAEEAPNAAEKIFRKLTLGASHYGIQAPTSGPVTIPFFSQSDSSADRKLRSGGMVRYRLVKGRKWFILPAVKREYVFAVGNQLMTIQVPQEFNLDDVVQKTFFPEAKSLQSVLVEQHDAHLVNALSESPMIQTGQTVEAGDPIVEFDITLGDALFVDRLSYHFIRPNAGDPFVFRTRDIAGIEGGPNSFVDKYYIKRIGGASGESISIQDGGLYLDGQPRDEVAAFERNAAREGDYEGYVNHEPFYFAEQQGFTGLGEGSTLQIPDDKFVALGDNSDNSLDSRYWGYVPEKAVIGRAIFIYYPFTKRWGMAE